MCSFKPYELSLRDIMKLFDGWDRLAGSVMEPEETEVEVFVHSSVLQTFNKKSDKKKQVEKERRKEVKVKFY